MRNIEKYKDIVLENVDACSIDERLRKINVSVYCKGYNCEDCKERFLKWLLEECKKPVLDDAERKYLSEVIRPFRKNVRDIFKKSFSEDKQYIAISVRNNSEFSEYIQLPNFKTDTMYKGMEENKKYSLEELDL